MHCQLTHREFGRSAIPLTRKRAGDVKVANLHDVLHLGMPAAKEAAGRKVPV